MIAGPSEVTIVADKFSNPKWIAADLIAQAEHDETSQSILLADNLELLKKVNFELEEQVKNLPKKIIASKSLKNYGIAILVKSKTTLINIINLIAPEHLEIFLKKSKNILNKIENAGSIFLGPYSPEAAGDYLAGPNHVLPTSGSARFSSGLSVYDFLKRRSIIKMSKTGIERLGLSVINLANYENLEGHANSIKIRLNKKGK
jgi:histidinol dehydrogenase